VFNYFLLCFYRRGVGALQYIRCSVSGRPWFCLPIDGCLKTVRSGRDGIGRSLNGGQDPWGSPFPLEGVHDFTGVWGGNSIKGGKSSGDSVSDQESEDTNHCQTSIVDFNQKASFTLFIAHFSVELEGIVKIRDPVDSFTEFLESGVLSGLSSTHVVGKGGIAVSSHLVPDLEESDDGNDLPLGVDVNQVPLFLGLQIGGRRHGTGERLRPAENQVGLDAVSDEGSHGNTSVLDLGLSQESDGGLVCVVPEFTLGKVEGIVEPKDRVQFKGKTFEVGLGFVHGDRRGRRRSADEGGSGSDRGGEEDKRLEHDEYIFEGFFAFLPW